MLKLAAPISGTGVSEASFEELSAAIRKGGALERAEAARRMGACGAVAVPLLCNRLTDPCVPVRLAAAKALGEIGDPAAILALTQALHGCFQGGSARRQLATGCLGATGLGLACLVMVILNPLIILEGLLRIGFEKLCTLGQPHPPALPPQISRAPVYARALARIAERHPTPELRALLPELRAASLDLLQLDPEARRVSRETADRIERLTTRLRTLPTPAFAPSPEEHVLPLPAAPWSSGEALPRPGE